MMDEFTSCEIQTHEASIFVRSFGSGTPILLLHGFQLALGIDRDLRLMPIEASPRALASVAHLGVMHRNHPIRTHSLFEGERDERWRRGLRRLLGVLASP